MIIVNSLLKQISLIYCNRLSILSIIELSFSFHGRATYIIYLYDVQNTAFLSSFKSIIFSILLIILLYWYHNKDIWEINGAQPTKELFNNENNESWSFETDWRFMMNFSDCFFFKTCWERNELSKGDTPELIYIKCSYPEYVFSDCYFKCTFSSASILLEFFFNMCLSNCHLYF